MDVVVRTFNGIAHGDKVVVATGLNVAPAVTIMTEVNGETGIVDLSLATAERLAEAIYEAIKRTEESDDE